MRAWSVRAAWPRAARGAWTRRACTAWLAAGLLVACGRTPAPEGGGAGSVAPASPPDTSAFAAPEQTPIREPFVPNGSPMPPAEAAAGIPPYPNAVVHVVEPRRSEVHYLEAFTTDPWEVVVDYYTRRLSGWTITHAEDTVIFEKAPDQAAVTVQPWENEVIPAEMDEVLRRSRTAIGTAWR